ncbi:uncharacterized protein [Anabrus simplex]|uniref:uncharacterized protein n=1 Tax=Anabrus simplex TaxID=316456 RepID=UPI0035A348C9
MPRGQITEEQRMNIKLVQEVKKYPCLYNHTLDDYSKRNVVEAAWDQVALAMDDTVAGCKDKWRNLRTVFVRKHKFPPGSSGRNSKPYYLSEIMQFVLPFVKVHHSFDVPTNIPSPVPEPDATESLNSVERDNDDNELTETEDCGTRLVDSEQNVSLAAVCEKGTETSDSSHEKKCGVRRKLQSNHGAGIDRVFMEYFKEKRRKLEKRESPRKYFLLSLVPDVEMLSDGQFRVFRRKVLDAIDYAIGYQDTPQLSSTGSSSEYVSNRGMVSSQEYPS